MLTLEQELSVLNFKQIVSSVSREDLEQLAIETFSTLLMTRTTTTQLLGEKWGILNNHD